MGEACDRIVVLRHEPETAEVPIPALDGWYEVTTDAGIVAYVGDETLALKIRLWLINDLLNQVNQELLAGGGSD
jgi:hypothetical protein